MPIQSNFIDNHSEAMFAKVVLGIKMIKSRVMPLSIILHFLLKVFHLPPWPVPQNTPICKRNGVQFKPLSPKASITEQERILAWRDHSFYFVAHQVFFRGRNLLIHPQRFVLNKGKMNLVIWESIFAFFGTISQISSPNFQCKLRLHLYLLLLFICIFLKWAG